MLIDTPTTISEFSFRVVLSHEVPGGVEGKDGRKGVALQGVPLQRAYGGKSKDANFQIFVFPNGKVIGQCEDKKGGSNSGGDCKAIAPGVSMVLMNLEANIAVVPAQDLLLMCLTEISVHDASPAKQRFRSSFIPLNFGKVGQCHVHEREGHEDEGEEGGDGDYGDGDYGDGEDV